MNVCVELLLHMLISSVSSFFALDYHQQTEEENEATITIEENLWKELEAVKVNIVYISPNLWYYQVL